MAGAALEAQVPDVAVNVDLLYARPLAASIAVVLVEVLAGTAPVFGPNYLRWHLASLLF